MFKSIGRAFKKLFAGKSAKASNNTVTKAKVVNISEVGVSNNASTSRGSNYTAPKTKSRRVQKWRAKNRVARTSRNDQHRLKKAA